MSSDHYHDDPQEFYTDDSTNKSFFGNKIFGKTKILLTVSILLVFAITPFANAVTYPDKSNVKPSDSDFMVSLWATNPDTFERTYQVCSGVLLSSQVILTAAHCVIDNKDLVAVLGQSDRTDRGESISIYKWKIHPRYSKTTSQNDIALGILNFASRHMVGQYMNFSNKFVKGKTRIYGWGIDQNEIDNGTLMSVLQNDYTSTAKKYYPDFNSQTMVAGGYYNSVEKTYAGACHGDSGGPLLVNNGTSYSLIGLVSYGSALGCDVKRPTVYTKVYYYLTFISDSIKELTQELVNGKTTIPKLDTFNRNLGTSVSLPSQTGPYGYYTYAPVQSGGGVKSPDINSIMFQTYSGSGTSYGINFYLTNTNDLCVEKQKGSWIVQVSTSDKQNVDLQFNVNPTNGCYAIDNAEFNRAIIVKSPPAQTYCGSPSLKPWKLKPEDNGVNVISVYFSKGCIGDTKTIWVRVFHGISGDGGDLEPGLDMWAGPFSTAVL
jgi:trypsin